MKLPSALSFFVVLPMLSLGCVGPRDPSGACGECPTGMLCDTARKRCAVPCNSPADCSSGNACLGGFCVAGDPVDIGGACQSDGQCDDGNPCNGVEVCASGTCSLGTQGPLADGASCGVEQECIDQMCTNIECGNGVVNTGEECDDGNTIDGPTCSADCQIAAACGDGVVHAWAGETCDYAGDVEGCDTCDLLPGYGCDEAACFGVIYVNASAEPDGNGETWGTAYTSLHDALAEAYEWEATDSRPQPKEIWVAQGTYVPQSSFVLVSDVNVYGGFVGTEFLRDARDPQTNLTVLSGDAEGNDVPDDSAPTGWTPESRTDNRQHVVTINSGVSAVIDGVTIANGHADAASCDSLGQCFGGGALVVCTGPAPMVGFRNVIFEGNYASEGGGAVGVVRDGDCEDIAIVGFEGSVLRSNRGHSGGAIHSFSTHLVALGTMFLANHSIDGGAIYSDKASMLMFDPIFENNRADRHGGALFATESIADILLAMFENNSAGAHGGAVYGSAESLIRLKVASFKANSTTGHADHSSRGGAVYMDDAGLELQNVEVIGSRSLNWGGALVLRGGALGEFSNVIFFDNTVTETGGGGALYCENSQTLIWSATFAGNGVGSGITHGGRAIRGGGTCQLSLHNSVVWGNGTSQLYFPGDDAILSVEYSLVEGGDTADNNLNVDPQFVDQAGGNLRLQTGCPAINTGDPATLMTHFLTDDDGVAIDLDRNPRVSGGSIDMGAYEYQE